MNLGSLVTAEDVATALLSGMSDGMKRFVEAGVLTPFDEKVRRRGWAGPKIPDDQPILVRPGI